MSEEYEPYGEEWEKAVIKLPKAEIVGMLRRAGTARCELLEALRAVYPLIGRGFVQVGSTLRSGKGHIEAAIAKAEGRAES